MLKKLFAPKSDRKPVAKVVHEILAQGQAARTDGPASGLYSRDAQLSSALTRAGTLLAKMDGAAPAKRSVLQGLLGASAEPKQPRRSWLFGSKHAASLDAKKIEIMLRAAAKDGRPLVLDRDFSETQSNGDIECTLPDGAEDPVCTPR